MLRPNLKFQTGFGLIAFFVVAVIMISVLTYFVAGSGMAAPLAGDQIAIARANSIIAEGGLLRGAVDRILASGNVLYVTFDIDPDTGVFGRAGGIDAPYPDPAAYNDPRDPFGFWNGSGTIMTINGVGTPGKRSYVAITAGLKDSVCMVINQRLHQSPAVPPSGYSMDDIAGGFPGAFATWTREAPFASSGTHIDLSGLHQVDGWENGCLATTSGINIYFQVLHHH